MYVLFVQGMSQVMQCLQDQLGLLAMKTEGDHNGLITAANALQGPIDTLKNTLAR